MELRLRSGLIKSQMGIICILDLKIDVFFIVAVVFFFLSVVVFCIYNIQVFLEII